MSANNRQVGGNHYKSDDGIQHWDLVNMLNLNYFEGQITKYLLRSRKKNGIQDLEKALHFLEKYLQVRQEEASGWRILLDWVYSAVRAVGLWRARLLHGSAMPALQGKMDMAGLTYLEQKVFLTVVECRGDVLELYYAHDDLIDAVAELRAEATSLTGKRRK